MLHRGHVGLRNSIEDVADEEIALRITVREKGGAVYEILVRHVQALRTFTHSNEI